MTEPSEAYELPAAAGHRLEVEPWYLPIGDEVEIFLAAFESKLPVLLKGPTGCGKTRFVEYVTWKLYRNTDSYRNHLETPLITVACHEDLTATDLVGRYLLTGDET
ncbi:MAG: AAA family ATPase, partial [Gammaproteobacteria bacterium]